MKTLPNALKTFTLACLLAAPIRPTQAVPLAHTFVSHSGNDGNPCTASSPCLTFTGALANTAPEGQIDALDTGDYGPATITQPVTIDGGGRASIVSTSGAAITVTTSGGGQVILRHLSINGGANVGNGIVCNSVGTLTIDDCTVTGYRSSNIYLFNTGGGSVVIKHTTLTGGSFGVTVADGMGTPGVVSLRDVTIQNCGYGLNVLAGVVDITNSLLTQNAGYGVAAQGASTVNVAGCTLSNNSTAVRAATAATIRLTQNNLWNNTIGIDTFGSGVVSTAQDNRKAGNQTSGAPTPGKVITVQ